MRCSSGFIVLRTVATLIFSHNCFAQPVVDGAAERNLLTPPGMTGIRLLSQNWSAAEARRFYSTTQGSQMIPYVWFLHLEQHDSTTLFRDPAHLRALGYLTRAPEQSENPDGLPVGFVRNGASMGLTCAACHTAQINYQGTAWLIDGGPANADLEKMMVRLEAALRATSGDPQKFDRFAVGVLGSNSADAAKTAALKEELKNVLARRSDYNARNFPAVGKPSFGPGRIDAFNAIFNEVAVRFAQSPGAKTVCDAPVSYPFLWDTPQHDRVQWNGSAPNLVIAGAHIGALGRNIGEILGVFADVETTKRELPLGGYQSSVDTDNLKDLEKQLSRLWSPQWPEALGKIDQALATKGSALFAQHCASCHFDIKRDDPYRKIVAQMSVVGTDQSMARIIANRTSPSGIFEGRRMLLPPFRKLKPTEPVVELLGHLVQRVLVGSQLVTELETVPFSYDVIAEIGEGNSKVSVTLNSLEIAEGRLVKARVKSLALLQNGVRPAYLSTATFSRLPQNLALKFSTTTDNSLETFTAFNADIGAETPVNYPYKARPLNGIWATAPYLHNGSVLNLDELLKPARDRMVTFHLGSREFDPGKVGFTDSGDFLFDTKAQPGNSNAGHEYGAKVFTPAERAQLVEYMKSL